ncbi:MAG: ATP-binding protein [Planctomycetaceae bacterium]|nr:ATP-binding protein [Planctomycetaceae bacterium]
MTQTLTSVAREFIADNALESLPHIREFLRSVCEESLGAHPQGDACCSQIAELELAATELISNIIRHGFKGLPRTALRLLCQINSSGLLKLVLTHQGRPYRPGVDDIPDITEPLEGGMGLYLISECVDEVSYSTLADGTNQIQLTKTLTFFPEGT